MLTLLAEAYQNSTHQLQLLLHHPSAQTTRQSVRPASHPRLGEYPLPGVRRALAADGRAVQELREGRPQRAARHRRVHLR